MKRAVEAVNPGGALMVYDEMLAEDRGGAARSLLMSLNVRLVRSGGSEYTIGDCRGWLTAAGFAEVTATNLTPSGWRVRQVPVLQFPGVVERVPGTTADQELQRP